MSRLPTMSYSAVHYTDINKYVVKLPYGEYVINGDVVNVVGNETVQTDSIDNICRLTRGSIVSKYVDCDLNELSVVEYETQRSNILKHRNRDGDEYDEVYAFDSVEHEVEYIKLTKGYTAVYKHIEEVSDPLNIQCAGMLYDTGNEFVKPAMVFGESTNPALYKYARWSYHMHILRTELDKLGFVCSGDKVSYEKTATEKIWGIGHGNIEYVTCFGKYPFTDFIKNTGASATGIMDDMLKLAEKDRSDIKKIISDLNRQVFGNFDDGKFNHKEAMLLVKHALSDMARMDIKLRSKVNKPAITKRLNKLNDLIVEAYDVEEV